MFICGCSHVIPVANYSYLCLWATNLSKIVPIYQIIILSVVGTPLLYRRIAGDNICYKHYNIFPGPDPGGNALERQVLELLSSDTYSWDELLEAVSDDIESRLDETLEELQATNRIRYSGRHGGYTTVGGGGDGD